MPAVVWLIDAIAGRLPALLGTLLLAIVFYGLTAHIAARYVLGDVPISRALLVGVVPALIGVVLAQFGPVVVIGLSLAGDFVAIQTIYRLNYRTAGLVAVIHYTVSAILGITLYNLVRLVGTMPA